MPDKKHSVIILGGGPAGACTAMYLLRRGIKPVIVERDAFPRYLRKLMASKEAAFRSEREMVSMKRRALATVG